jgi:hypothetical protein
MRVTEIIIDVCLLEGPQPAHMEMLMECFLGLQIICGQNGDIGLVRFSLPATELVDIMGCEWEFGIAKLTLRHQGREFQLDYRAER